MATTMAAEYLWRAPFRMLFVVVLAVLAYLCIRAVSKLFKVCQETFVLWTIAFGHSWVPKSKNMRIHPYFCRTAEMDELSIEECYRFHLIAFEAAPGLDDVRTRQIYKKVLLSYSHALLCRDREDGSLRGLLLVGVDHKPTYTVVKVGMMLFHSHYRGGPWMKLLEAVLAIREIVLHPFTPIYAVAKVSTYKPYLVAQLYRECYPHYAKEAPELYKQIAEEYVRGSGLPEESYDRETFVLKRRVAKLQKHVAPISDRDLKNPHIKFYNERNSGWREGDQLVTVWHVTWFDFLNMFQIMMMKILYAGKGRGAPRGIGAAGNINARRASKIQEIRLQRGLTFQDATSSILAAQYMVCEYGEEVGRKISELPSPLRTPNSAWDLTELDIDYHF